MKKESDADWLFRRAGNYDATKLHQAGKKLKRAEDRKTFWAGRKQEKRRDG